jgi:hypothetical protein
LRRADSRYFRLAYAAWLFGIFAFYLPGASWNPVSRFCLTRALVEERGIAIDTFAKHTGDRARVGGHWYSDKAPVVAFLAAPAYAAVHVTQRLRGIKPEAEELVAQGIRINPNRAYQQGLHAASLSVSGLAGVAVALLLFELLRRRTTSRVAFLGSSFVVLGSPLLPYATNLYGHTVAAAFLLGALVSLDRRGQRAETLTPTRWRIAGACLTLAVGCEYLTLFPGAVLALWYVGHSPRKERFGALLNLAAGAFLPAVFIGAYHAAAFGAPWKTGYSYITRQEFASGHAQGLLGINWPTPAGLYGLTFGPRRGLFYLWPMLLFALMFTGLQATRRKDLAASAGLLVLGVLFFANAGYYMWWGGAALGPRHMVPGIPILALGLALALRSGGRWLARVAVAFGVLSIITTLLATGLAPEPPERPELQLRQYLLGRLAEGRVWTFAGASNLGTKLGLAGNLSFVPLLIWVAVGYWYLLGQVQRARASDRYARRRPGRL